MASEGRNRNIETAVDKILDQLDKLIEGESLSAVVPQKIARLFDATIQPAKGSVRLAMAFFISYSLTCKDWDFASIPVGIRGTYGDKKLAAGLTSRHVTYHMAVTAFGENLGWKGNVRNFDLKGDPRFANFVSELVAMSSDDKAHLFNHAIWRMFESRAIPKAMPPLPKNYMTYARSLALCEDLLALKTEGHVQQFLVAAFLTIHRGRFGNTVKTHHPHASDTFDGTSGDIEEFRDGSLVAAYEVTVRDDWKNRLPDFHAKMVKGRLTKYVIFASGVHSDARLASAKKLIEFTRGIEFDLAIVDIRDFFCVFCAELTKDEIAMAINLAYEFLLRPDLCGKSLVQNQFQNVVDIWMGAAA